jgi:high-affinity iron transporter
MFSTAIIILREVIEIAMILSVLLAATHGLPGRMLWIVGGMAGGLAGAGLVATFAETISASLSGLGQEFFNALILFVAAIIIGSTVIWMRSHSAALAQHLKQVGKDVSSGKLPMYSLALVCGLTILREGSEIVLFVYGMALSGQGAVSIALGCAIGLSLGLLAGTLMYFGLLKVPARHVLQVTSWMLMLLVAGLASQAVVYLSAAGYFPNLSYQVWNTSWLLSEDNILGKGLHSLIGYSARPTAIQLIVYAGTLTVVLGIVTVNDRKKKPIAMSVAAVAFFAMVMGAHPAYALDEIYSPNVVPNELSFEYSGSTTFDRDPNKRDAESHEFAVEYGLNDRVTLEASGTWTKDPNAPTKFDSTEVEGRFQFAEQGEDWIDTGLLVAYSFPGNSTSPHELEVKLLLEKDVGKFTTLANVGFEWQVGANAEDGGPDYVLLANERYRLNYYLEPGVEFQGDLGQRRNIGRINNQEDYVGPALYGHLMSHLKYQVAYLFGASTPASNSAARVLFEYETALY